MTEPTDSTASSGRVPLAHQIVGAVLGTGDPRVTYGGAGQEEQERKLGEGAVSNAALLRRMQASEERQERQYEQMVLFQQQMRQFMMGMSRTQYGDTASLARPVAASPLNIHTMSPAAAGEYSASASIPLPPLGAQHRRYDPRRQSMGMPLGTPIPAPALSTPGPVRFTGLDGPGEDKELGSSRPEQVTAAVADPVGLPPYSKRMEKIREAVSKGAKQYHGSTELDAHSVIDWVEKVDTLFSIQMGEVQEGRLDIVRSLLEGTALKWMNRSVLEKTEQLSRGEISEVIEWNTMRQPFIDAHLGINTAETFKAELRTLRLGSSLCPSPVELNKQFDHLAELAYPDRRANGMASVMGDEYKRVIAASRPFMYKSIALNQVPTTIDEWKKAVANRWAAEKDVEATMAQLPQRAGQQQRGRGGATRGGAQWHGRGGTTSGSQPHSATAAAAIEVDDGTGEEGENRSAEGPDSQRLNAAAGSSRRGGKAGRGGRGGNSNSGSNVFRNSDNVECWNCHEKGHFRSDCPNAIKSKPQQSKEKADQ